MTKDLDKFSFWCPLEKAQEIDPTTGETVMKLGGIASTSDEDADGEFLDPKGFDIRPLLESGMVNWHHQAKGQPAAIIGEPTKAEIRPEGLYIETQLYPSSKIAHDVWELAETLEKNSKTRRLGYSIEGKVVKRKSDDKNSPDYKKIEKAIITGVAITHQPKNPKTFANIIKGEIDDNPVDEEEQKVDLFDGDGDSNKLMKEMNKKGLNTENGAALKKESVDKKLKNQTFGKSDVVERIFKDIPGISIEKAKKIHSLILNIANMEGKRTVTDEDIQKAYEALGLEIPEDVVKADDGDEPDGGNAEEDAPDKAKSKKVDKNADDVQDDGEGEDETDDDDVEEARKEKMKKGGGGENRFDRIEKAVATSHLMSSKFIKALGVMVKDACQKLEAAASREEELLSIVKAQEDTISAMSERLEEFGSGVPAPKSISAARPVERQFAKADEEGDIEKGGNRNVVSMSKQPNVVSEILDQATFSKGGYDDEFSKACMSFEASHILPPTIIARIKNEFGVEIVK